jgi:hypothetical protein
MDLKHVIESLCSFGHRGSATKEERQGADMITRFMEEIGLTEIDRQQFRHQQAFAWRYLTHWGAMLLSVIISFFAPWIAFCIGVITLISFYGEMSTRFDVLIHLAPAAISRNVIGKILHPRAKKKIILVAHHDTQKPSLFFIPPVKRLLGVRKTHTGYVEKSGNPFTVPFIAMLLLTGVFFVRAYGGSGISLNILEIAGAFVMVAAVGLMIQWGGNKRFVPGAVDNAAGVAVILDLAEKITHNPLKNSELWVVATGCEESGLGGMRHFLRKYGKTFDRDNTFFINIDGVGFGKTRYLVGEQSLVYIPYDPELIGIAAILSHREEFKDIRPLLIGLISDAVAAAARGFRAITITSFSTEKIARMYHQMEDNPENVDYPMVQQADEFAFEMIKMLDDL